MGKANKHKHRPAWAVPLVCLIIVAVLAVWAYAQPFVNLHPTVTFKPASTGVADLSLSWPSYGQAAIGATGYGVLSTRGDQKPLPTASIAKVITALSVLRQRPLHLGEQGPVITITQPDIDSYNKYVAIDGSVVPVNMGEQITEYQALVALLLPSANNMAETLARWAFGSIDAYNAYANSFAASLGLKSVHVTDPSGFLPTTVASAHDLTILGELAMQHPVLAQIVGLPSATIPVQGTVMNYNFLVGDNHNVGIKTGNNDQDPGAYLFAFKYPVGDTSVMVVGAIMGGPDLHTVQTAAHQLAGSAYPHFKLVTFIRKGQAVGSYDVPGQGAVQAVAAQDIAFVTWDGYSFASTARLDTLHGTTAAGATVGHVAVTNTGTHTVNAAAVVLSRTISHPSLPERLKHPL